MGIPLRIVDPWPPFEDREPGMMWRVPADDADGRESWWIVLPQDGRIGTPGHPSRIEWSTTERASKEPHDMWAVTGTPPMLTVTPSIDVECWVVRDGQTVRDGSYWHGYITNGELVG